MRVSLQSGGTFRRTLDGQIDVYQRLPSAGNPNGLKRSIPSESQNYVNQSMVAISFSRQDGGLGVNYMNWPAVASDHGATFGNIQRTSSMPQQPYRQTFNPTGGINLTSSLPNGLIQNGPNHLQLSKSSSHGGKFCNFVQYGKQSGSMLINESSKLNQSLSLGQRSQDFGNQSLVNQFLVNNNSNINLNPPHAITNVMFHPKGANVPQAPQNHQMSIRDWAEQIGFFDDTYESNYRFSKYQLSKDKIKKDKLQMIMLKSYLTGDNAAEVIPIQKKSPVKKQYNNPVARRSNILATFRKKMSMQQIASSVLLPQSEEVKRQEKLRKKQTERKEQVRRETMKSALIKLAIPVIQTTKAPPSQSPILQAPSFNQRSLLNMSVAHQQSGYGFIKDDQSSLDLQQQHSQSFSIRKSGFHEYENITQRSSVQGSQFVNSPTKRTLLMTDRPGTSVQNVRPNEMIQKNLPNYVEKEITKKYIQRDQFGNHFTVKSIKSIQQNKQQSGESHSLTQQSFYGPSKLKGIKPFQNQVSVATSTIQSRSNLEKNEGSPNHTTSYVSFQKQYRDTSQSFLRAASAAGDQTHKSAQIEGKFNSQRMISPFTAEGQKKRIMLNKQGNLSKALVQSQRSAQPYYLKLKKQFNMLQVVANGKKFKQQEQQVEQQPCFNIEFSDIKFLHLDSTSSPSPDNHKGHGSRRYLGVGENIFVKKRLVNQTQGERSPFANEKSSELELANFASQGILPPPPPLQSHHKKSLPYFLRNQNIAGNSSSGLSDDLDEEQVKIRLSMDKAENRLKKAESLEKGAFEPIKEEIKRKRSQARPMTAMVQGNNKNHPQSKSSLRQRKVADLGRNKQQKVIFTQNDDQTMQSPIEFVTRSGESKHSARNEQEAKFSCVVRYQNSGRKRQVQAIKITLGSLSNQME
ncbi:hypothetical protein FGO68_gene15851 [Halteria grandinella]|uniref:Uncharacterized protein n=1 Tax=Halteria grandinella TaxID=5974 RepID=A0A8J8T7T7_HALGN|nr:hypothetical protein FGO68_gene15851 [Halteria grandinella]